jgi:hypothetical protein
MSRSRRCPSQSNGIIVRDSSQSEFCNTIIPTADVRLQCNIRRFGPKATFLHCGKQPPNSLLLDSNYSNV